MGRLPAYLFSLEHLNSFADLGVVGTSTRGPLPGRGAAAPRRGRAPAAGGVRGVPARHPPAGGGLSAVLRGRGRASGRGLRPGGPERRSVPAPVQAAAGPDGGGLRLGMGEGRGGSRLGPLARGALGGGVADLRRAEQGAEVRRRRVRLAVRGREPQPEQALVRHEGLRQPGQGPSVLRPEAPRPGAGRGPPKPEPVAGRIAEEEVVSRLAGPIDSRVEVALEVAAGTQVARGRARPGRLLAGRRSSGGPASLPSGTSRSGGGSAISTQLSVP